MASIESDLREVADLSSDCVSGSDTFCDAIKRLNVVCSRGRGRKAKGKQGSISVRIRFVWPMDRPLISEFDDNGFTWLDFLTCAMHGDMRLAEWYVYHTICYSAKPLHEVNAFLIKIGSSLDLKIVKGKISTVTFQQHAKAKWWFEDNRWQKLVEFCDGKMPEGKVSDTWVAWATYAELREIFITMHPTAKDRLRFKELTLDFFVAYRLKFSLVKHVSHYVHHLFAHATMLMDYWKSIGAYMLQGFEHLHSEHKDVIQKVIC